MMPNELSNELFWLTLTIGLTAVMWIPYIINRMAEQGVLAALWDPFGHTEARAAWANRMMQAHANAVENLIIFAPLVLLVQLTGQNSDITVSACILYFVARLAHYVGFSLSVPLVRVVSFLIGFYAQLVLAYSLFKIA